MRKSRWFFITFINEKKLVYSYMVYIGFVAAHLWFSLPKPALTILPRHLAVPGRKVFLDAGHGGRDPGAVGRSGIKEKDITLEITKELHRLFSQIGVYTVLARDADLDLAEEGDCRYRTLKERDLWQRVKIANRSDADIYLSIHVNSFPQSIWSGAQTFYYSGNEDSKILANTIQAQLAHQLGPNKRSPKPADYRVLRSTKMPAVVVEVGFVSNPREERLLVNPDYQKKIAYAVYLGVVDYFCSTTKTKPVIGDALVGHIYPSPQPTFLNEGQASLFFADPNNDDIFLRREIRDLPGYQRSWGRIRKLQAILAELEKGPGEQSMLLPAAPVGKWLKGVSFSSGIVTVNLAQEFSDLVDGGGSSELLSLYAIVNTLTELPDVTGVRVLIEGESGRILGGHIALDHTWSRRDDLVKTDS
jgi:N-acetylmuramoyl-L-alanine amidase